MLKENKALISVIIPVFNVEKYLHRCLDSVTGQIGVNLEIILVDDGSTDASGKICDDYAGKDNRITVIHQKNGGASKSRNRGLREAKGEYIGFVDSDDWIASDMYRYLLSILQQYQADVAGCLYQVTDGTVTEGVQKEEVSLFSHSDMMDMFFRKNGEESNYSVWNRLYKKQIIEGIEFPDGYVNEDVFFSYFSFLKAKRAVFSNLKKYFYFKNPNGVTRGALRKQDLSLYYVWDKVLEHAKERNAWYEQDAVLNRQRAIFTLLSKYAVYGIEDRDVFSRHWLRQEKIRLRKAYIMLLKSGLFDLKRKAVLSVLCISPNIMRLACLVFFRRSFEKY